MSFKANLSAEFRDYGTLTQSDMDIIEKWMNDAESFGEFMDQLARSTFDVNEIPWNKGDLDSVGFRKLIDKHKKAYTNILKEWKDFYEERFGLESADMAIRSFIMRTLNLEDKK